MKRYKEVCSKHLFIGIREFNKGDVVRVVSITEADAKRNNEGTKDTGFEYVLEETPKNEDVKEVKKPGPKPKN